MPNVLPPPLSRAIRDTQAERARTVKDTIERLLGDIDKALAQPAR